MKTHTIRTRSLLGTAVLCLAALFFWGPAPRAAAQQHALTTSGRISQFVPASPISPGVLAIGSMRCDIAPGTVIEGQEMIRVGATLSLRATMDSEDRIMAPSAVVSQDPASLAVCGRLKEYAPSTYATEGRLRLDGGSWQIAPSVEMKGSMQLTKDADVCVTASLDGAGRISYPNNVTASATDTVEVCGQVRAYTPATAGAQGTLAIDGFRFTIARGAQLPGLSVGANLCLTLCLNHNGEVFDLSLGGTGGGPVSLCGFVTAYSAGGWAPGSITIGGQTLPIAPGTALPTPAPGSYLCMTPVIANGALVNGTVFSTSTPQQPSLRVAALVDGTTGIYGPPFGTDQFLLPTPIVFNVGTPAPAGLSIFPVNDGTFGRIPLLENTAAQGVQFSTANASARVQSCTDSFWDVVFYLATMGATDGDMVTFSLQNANGTGSQVLAMFTFRNGGAELTQLHPNIILLWSGQPRGVGSLIPFNIGAGSAGAHTPELALVFSQTAPALNGCFQLVSEIKRASGAGKTSVVLPRVQVKRMATPDDPVVSIGTAIGSGSLGWYPTGKVCDFVCGPCNPPPNTQPGTLAGTVFCDANDDGIQQAGEPGIGGVTIILTGTVTRTTTTNGNGAYAFDNLPPGTYQIAETQPSNVSDGKDTIGTLGGTASNDLFTDIVLPAGQSGSAYNFAEICATTTKKCDTICWRSTQYFLTFIRNLPGGTVLIPGTNANNPIGIQQNLNAVRTALQGGGAPSQRLSKEFVTGQLSLLAAGGQGSPVVFNTYWSMLRCSNISFAPVALSNGFVLSPDSLLNDLVEQTTQAIKTNSSGDFDKLAGVWALLNGMCPAGQ